MKSRFGAGGLQAVAAAKSSFAHNQGGPLMEKYIHHQNLLLFHKRLAEARTDAERKVLLQLLADEEAKEPLLKMAFSSCANLHQGAAAPEELALRSDS